MTNEDRWALFINELHAYINEHHLGPSKHTTMYNTLHYFKRKLKDGTLDEEKAKGLEDVLALRDLSLHTGGRRKKYNYAYMIELFIEPLEIPIEAIDESFKNNRHDRF